MFFEIGGRRIGTQEPLFVVAELGLNHMGLVARALAMVDAAAAAGASAVKLQTFRAADLVAPGCPPPAHVREASLQAFFGRFELDERAHVLVAARARAHGLAFMATPFSIDAVDMLERVGVDAYKIASGDLTYDALIERCARTGRPLVLSTGMGSLAETGHAVATARGAGATATALLHCVSAYPVPEGSQNLRAVQTLARVFATPVGLSDHFADTSAVSTLVALGGVIYERHLMLEDDDGVDAAVSSTPEQLADAVRVAARAAAALGHGRRECGAAEAKNVTASRRSLHAVTPLATGDVITAEHIRAVRPGSGLPPGFERELVGSTVRRPIEAGSPFVVHDLAPERSQRGVA